MGLLEQLSSGKAEPREFSEAPRRQGAVPGGRENKSHPRRETLPTKCSTIRPPRNTPSHFFCLPLLTGTFRHGPSFPTPPFAPHALPVRPLHSIYPPDQTTLIQGVLSMHPSVDPACFERFSRRSSSASPPAPRRSPPCHPHRSRLAWPSAKFADPNKGIHIDANENPPAPATPPPGHRRHHSPRRSLPPSHAGRSGRNFRPHRRPQSRHGDALRRLQRAAPLHVLAFTGKDKLCDRRPRYEAPSGPPRPPEPRSSRFRWPTPGSCNP